MLISGLWAIMFMVRSLVAPAAGGGDLIERFTATAVNMSSAGRPGVRTIEIGIERWSTDSERDRLLHTLREQGPEALLDRLREMPRVGYIRGPQGIGWSLCFARSIDRDEGRQVIIATNRPMRFWEASRRPRSAEYPFTLGSSPFV